MLAAMLETLAETQGEPWHVRSAGTHVAEGSGVSSRTRDALLAISELDVRTYGSHRSHQLSDADVAWAHVIIAAEADNVVVARRRHPDAATKTVQLAQFVRFAPLDASSAAQVAAVALLEPLREFDVRDPAGGDQDVYDECANELWQLAQAFATLVSEQDL